MYTTDKKIITYLRVKETKTEMQRIKDKIGMFHEI